MEKFKTWIKRSVNTNFLILTLISVFILIFALVNLSNSSGLTKLLAKLKQLIDTANRNEEMGDVEGYAVVFGWLVYATVSFGNSLVKSITVYIPLIVALLTAAYSVIAKLVFAPQGGGLICYRVIICLCLLTLITPFGVYTLFSFFDPLCTVIMLAADVVVVIASFICIINTYTDRIKQ